MATVPLIGVILTLPLKSVVAEVFETSIAQDSDQSLRVAVDLYDGQYFNDSYVQEWLMVEEQYYQQQYVPPGIPPMPMPGFNSGTSPGDAINSIVDSKGFGRPSIWKPTSDVPFSHWKFKMTTWMTATYGPLMKNILRWCELHQGPLTVMDVAAEFGDPVMITKLDSQMYAALAALLEGEALDFLHARARGCID